MLSKKNLSMRVNNLYGKMWHLPLSDQMSFSAHWDPLQDWTCAYAANRLGISAWDAASAACRWAADADSRLFVSLATQSTWSPSGRIGGIARRRSICRADAPPCRIFDWTCHRSAFWFPRPHRVFHLDLTPPDWTLTCWPQLDRIDLVWRQTHSVCFSANCQSPNLFNDIEKLSKFNLNKQLYTSKSARSRCTLGSTCARSFTTSEFSWQHRRSSAFVNQLLADSTTLISDLTRVRLLFEIILN